MRKMLCLTAALLVICAGTYAGELHEAAEKGDRDAVVALLAKGAKVDGKDDNGHTPLHLATFAGHKPVAELLLTKGANIEARTPGGFTPLHTAALGGRKETTELLLAKGADVSAKTDAGATPLDSAIANDHKDVAALLAKHGAVSTHGPNLLKAKFSTLPEVPVNTKPRGATFHTLDMAGSVVLAGKDKYCGFRFRTPADVGELAWSCTDISGWIGSWYILAEQGTMDGFTEFRNHSLPADTPGLGKAGTRFILQSLPGKNLKKDSSYLIWFKVGKEGNAQLAKKAPLQLLVSMNVLPPGTPIFYERIFPKLFGAEALHYAAGLGHKEVVESLLAEGADIKATDEKGMTPLHLAAMGGHKHVVELLLAKGADVNAKEEGGVTPLHVGALGGRDVTELLLAKGANVNAMDEDGSTPLHYAASSGDKEVVQLLLAKGARTRAKDKEGNTPLSLATEEGHKEVAELLRKHGGK